MIMLKRMGDLYVPTCTMVGLWGIRNGSRASPYVGMGNGCIASRMWGMGICVDRKWWRWTVTLGWGWADVVGR